MDTVRIAGTVYADDYVSPISAFATLSTGKNYSMLFNETYTAALNYHADKTILVRFFVRNILNS